MVHFYFPIDNQPLEDRVDIDKAVHWVLGHLDLFLNTVGDIDLLPTVLDAASRFQRRPTKAEMEELAQKNKIFTLFGLGP